MSTQDDSPLILVVAAVVVRRHRVLLTQRESGSHLAGYWEFPGGKIEAGEDPPTALRRELMEELGVDAVVEAPFAFNHHAYPGKRVLLLTYLARFDGDPRKQECAALGWFTDDEVRALNMPPADGPILTRLLPMLAAAG